MPLGDGVSLGDTATAVSLALGVFVALPLADADAEAEAKGSCGAADTSTEAAWLARPFALAVVDAETDGIILTTPLAEVDEGDGDVSKPGGESAVPVADGDNELEADVDAEALGSTLGFLELTAGLAATEGIPGS